MSKQFFLRGMSKTTWCGWSYSKWDEGSYL